MPIFVFMNVQLVIVILLFAAAVIYIGRMMVQSMKPAKGCGSSCKCGIDFSEVENKA